MKYIGAMQRAKDLDKLFTKQNELRVKIKQLEDIINLSKIETQSDLDKLKIKKHLIERKIRKIKKCYM